MLQYTIVLKTVHDAAVRQIAQIILVTAVTSGVLLGTIWGINTTQATNAVPIQSTIESQLVAATNEQRHATGEPSLEWNASLYQAASAKAADMFHKQYFDHIAPDGTTPWSFIRPRYAYETAGENLAVDFTQPMDAIPAWMRSPSHKANILDAKFHDIAIVVAHGTLHGKQTTLIVQMFGEPSTNIANILSLHSSN